EVRRHRHLGDAGAEPDQQAADDEQDRIRDPQRPGKDQQRGARDEEQEKLKLLMSPEGQDHAGTLGAVGAQAELPSAALISSSAACSAGLTFCPSSRCAFATFSTRVTTNFR